MPGGGLPRTPPGGLQRGAEGRSQEEEGKGLQGEVVPKGAEGKLMTDGGHEAPSQGSILRAPSPAGYYDPSTPSEVKEEDVEKKRVKKDPPPNIEEKKEVRGRKNSKGDAQGRGASGKRTSTKPPVQDEMTYDSIPMTYAFSEGSKRTNEESPTEQGTKKNPRKS